MLKIFYKELSAELKDKVLETFKVFDADDNKEIDKSEALKHWKNGFGRLSAKEFFD